MTVVNIKVQVPRNGAAGLASGALTWQPTSRRIGTDGALVLPVGFRVPLVDGLASVDVEPSSSLWAWRVTEHFTGQMSKTKYLAVPGAGPVDYTDLVEVDPVTLDTSLSVSPDPDNPGFYLIGV